MRYGLTHQQQAALDFIAVRIEADRVAPTIDEIREHLGLASKGGAQRLVLALVERGRIRHQPNRARSITLVDDDPIGTAEAAQVILKRLDLSPACRAELAQKAGVR